MTDHFRLFLAESLAGGLIGSLIFVALHTIVRLIFAVKRHFGK